MLEKIFQKKYIVLYEIIAAILVFTIIYFIVIVNASHAFEFDSNKELYDNKIRLISKSAEAYGLNNLNLFKDKDTIYVTVDELVEKGYILADNEKGDVKDPSSEVKTLNDYKIRITYEHENLFAKVLNS